jgi:hypothetical protein
MGNTMAVKLPALSNQIYKEWLPKTVLVQSCDNAFEGELNLETLELDIPVYHDITIHQTTIKERDLKPAPVEFLKSSTKRVIIDKGRYVHWGKTKLSTIFDRLSQDESQARTKLVKKWAIAAETELGRYCAFDLGAAQTINIPTILSWSTTGYLTKDNILGVLDILKAKAISKNMEPSEFKLFASEAFESVARDTKLPLGSLDANETFRTGFVGLINNVDVRKIQIADITTRNSSSGLVEAEYAIWKTKDGIQYVVPYKNTVEYEIKPSEVLLGGTAYQTVEYYDFFNIYPSRLFRVPLFYKANPSLPTKS